ncbi:hypothetical protein, partial [Coxiella burnetii]|uniref:hypothetical protein n=2 Tax=Coxiella burnetii TaxID=777 RepID=UPI001EE443B7
IFCNINTQYFNIFHGPSPFFENRNSMLAHYDAVFKGWLHFIGLLVETATFNRARPLTLTCLKSTIPLSLGVFTRGLI